MLGPLTPAAADYHAHHQRHPMPASGYIVTLGRAVEQLLQTQKCKVDSLVDQHGALTHEGRSDGNTRQPVLGDRHFDDPLSTGIRFVDLTKYQFDGNSVVRVDEPPVSNAEPEAAAEPEPDPAPAPAEPQPAVPAAPDGSTGVSSPAGTYQLVEETALRALAQGAETDISLDSYARGSITVDENGWVTGSIQLSYLSDTSTVVGAPDDPESIVYTAVVTNTSTLESGALELEDDEGGFVFNGRLAVTVTWFNPHLDRQESGSTELLVTGRLDAVEGLFQLALIGDDGFVELRR